MTTPAATPPNLLNDDGTASMATAFMMSHHGFRRDLARFAAAVAQVAAGDTARAAAVGEEWKSFHGALHGHHQIEDTAMFPGMRAQHPALAATFDRLAADHRQIDPLLERGDRAFADLQTAHPDAAAVIGDLRNLLDAHLALEEAEIVPHLRAARSFPPPPDDAAAAMYADGFAWSAHGIASEVLEQVFQMLPPVVTERLPGARAAFASRCERVWGTAQAGAAKTPIPNGP